MSMAIARRFVLTNASPDNNTNVQKSTEAKTDDRRTIKSADFIARFYRPIFSAKLEQVRLLNLSPKYRPIKSGDKIGRVT